MSGERESSNMQNRDWTELVEMLAEAAAAPLARNDLGPLARMHTWCDEIRRNAGQQDQPWNELLGALRALLERVILGEAPDPDSCLEYVPAAAQMLQTGAAGEKIEPDDLIARMEAALVNMVEDADGVGVGAGDEPSETNAVGTTPAADEPVSNAITAMTALVNAGVSRADLGGLAQIHTCCEKIVGATSAEGDERTTGLYGVAGALLDLVSGLILDEVADTRTGFALVPRASTLLADVHNGVTTEVTEVIDQVRDVIRGAVLTPPAESEPVLAPPVPEPMAATPPPAVAPTPEPVVSESRPTATVEVAPFVSQPLKIDLDDRENLQGFVDEAREHLDTIEASLLQVEEHPTDADKINELFRPFHTIKGIAGFLNLRDINCLTHEAETILDMGRKGTMTITPGIIDLIFAAIDILKSQVNAVAAYMAEPTGEYCLQPPCAEMVVRLRRVAAGEAPEAGNRVAPAAVPVADVKAAASTPAAQTASTIAAPVAEAAKAGTKDTDQLSIRVDTRKLDALVDTVGELVIAQTMVNMNSSVDQDETLRRNVTQVTKIVRDVQEASMAMRMLPIGGTFQKMKRLVRDVSRKAGKTVELIVSGEDTEIDKNVIQKIADPLVHMVRNAVDHGIEAPERRQEIGKPPTGYVYLDAHHEGDNVVIEIRDDGAGLDPRKLIAKGVERGMIGADEQLSDKDAYGLIMAPGFSTAAKVTDISGRGVGMDVVKRNIEGLRGKIDIDSELGKGSVFRIILPLTLAIIDGMIVRVGDERFVMPTILIEQSLRPTPSQITTVQQRGEMLQVRGQLCPLVQIGQLFDIGPRIDPCDALVMVVQSGAQKMGIVVDELIGQQQIVIKSLGEQFKAINGVSGAAILGDGRVGLIMEPVGVLALHKSRRVETGLAWVRRSIAASEEAAETAARELADLAGELSEGLLPRDKDQQTVEPNAAEIEATSSL
ncbi:MAG: chemotaxis protein CheA [Phycisphaerae bacterium]|nr:chemotaxis protein CheA [Phycisphaerae bacterium]